jgi:hypothetical protein
MYSISIFYLPRPGFPSLDIDLNSFVKFISSISGRITRIVAGIALIAWGILGLTGTAGIKTHDS